MNEQDQLEAELQKLEQDIADQQARRAALLVTLSGSGAAALGERAVAVGEGGVGVGGDVGGHVVIGEHIVISELPQPVLELFARQFGFDPSASDAGALRAYFNNVVFEKHSKLSFLFIRPETGKVYTEADIETVFVPLRITDPEAAERQSRASGRLERFDRMADEMAEGFRPLTLAEILKKHPCVL
ncbi:MAG: hypothetical protein GY842_18430, partial [bacterium]|nr:hypothetical protein [bacterium]